MLTCIEKTLEGTGMTVNATETSVEFPSSKYDDLIARVETHKKAMEVLELAILEEDAEIWRLRTALDKAEQYSRCKNVEIHGMQQNENAKI